MSLDHEVQWEGRIAALVDRQSVHTQNRDQVSARVHQQVLVVIWEETLDQLEGGLVNALDDQAALLRLDVEASTLVLRHTN